ncbi:DUF3990 domain-containing protein [Bifidobacterium cuniculi]|uniref:DUF3990 domain-containing protein n=1 Tax=Bifidobacterium cuniculi TaxID=1688 RepID=A0A087B3T5_9BIFI|nr:DUF3990 domain-containing protein [Bifidobacterium cuniculi]KFI65685.1 hypothetical protein BCUN_0180 [Bifidobacterium cuniculi]
MLLFHGSNVTVEQPRVLRSDRRLDFGTGFYVTSSYEQAAKWSVLTARRRRTGSPLISVYEYDEAAFEDLNVLEFPAADEDWLRFVSGNRNGQPEVPDLDLVIGPVANDNTMPVLRGFFAQIYTEEEAIRRLMTQKLKDQYAFKTEAALQAISFLHVEEA